MRRIAPLLLALIAACVAVPATHALAQAPSADAARLQRFLPIARAAWPDSACAGREAVHLTGDAALRASGPAIAGPGEALNGMADPGTCEVWLAGDLTERTFWTVLVHELGHLAGRGHTAEPGDIMNADGDLDWPACDRGTEAPATEQVYDVTETRTTVTVARAD